MRKGETPKLTLILRRSNLVDGGLDGAAPTGGPDAGGDGDVSVDARPVSPDAPGADAPTVGRITLAMPTKDSNGINLAWSTAEPFESFKVYRATDAAKSFGVVDILNDPKAQTYRDTTALLGATYRYRIAGLIQGHAEVVSNEQTMTAGVFIAVNTQVERMKADPKRPYLYAVDRVNNSLVVHRRPDQHRREDDLRRLDADGHRHRHRRRRGLRRELGQHGDLRDRPGDAREDALAAGRRYDGLAGLVVRRPASPAWPAT